LKAFDECTAHRGIDNPPDWTLMPPASEGTYRWQIPPGPAARRP
jgi:hypothetical protein